MSEEELENEIRMNTQGRAGERMKYHKINSLFKRDEKGRFTSEWARPEFEYLKNNLWTFDEKIDGTNIRINWDTKARSFAGRTDNAQIPARLYGELESLFPTEKLQDYFADTPVTLYGEGYGAKIQKGGGNYIADGCSFILFDVRIGQYWMTRENVEDIAKNLDIKVTPLYGTGTLMEAIRLLRHKDLHSLVSDSAQAEGFILRPLVPLVSRNGDRVISKLKVRDFR